MKDAYNWYKKLKKPKWAPPSSVFGPVWTVLYIIIAYTFGMVFYNAAVGNISWIITLPFVLNLVFNFSFTTLQFKLRNNFLAAIDIVLVLLTLVWGLVVISPICPIFIYLNIPYLLWVSFATVLQLTITSLNKK